MEDKYSIAHSDISTMGYYFYDARQEKAFLESINDELACRVGKYFLQQKNAPELDLLIWKLRTSLMEELWEHRRELLLKGAEHSFSESEMLED